MRKVEFREMVFHLQNVFFPCHILYNYISIFRFTFDKNKASNILVLIIVVCIIIIFTVINVLTPNCDITTKYNMADSGESENQRGTIIVKDATVPSTSLKSTSDSININLICESFKKCTEQEDFLSMDHYLVAYHELYRFFLSLGPVFSFVANDVINKINILEEYRKSENAEHYSSIQKMISYEKENNLLTRNDQPSGCRTLLRLHRALEFITVFVRSLSQADDEMKTSAIAQESYQNTLAKFHPWLIKKGAILAMYTLPSRQNFIEKVVGSVPDDASEQMGKLADSCEIVYNMTQNLYANDNLLQLP